MSELEEWRKKNRESAISDPEEVLKIIMKTAKPNEPKYRLELLFDAETKTILLQGNQAGLERILGAIQVLAQPDEHSGNHRHFDRQTGLTKADVDLIIQRVNDDDEGAHTIRSSPHN